MIACGWVRIAPALLSTHVGAPLDVFFKVMKWSFANLLNSALKALSIALSSFAGF